MRYPLFLDLRDKPVLVVGGGARAAMAVEGLLVAPEATESVRALAAKGRLRWEPRRYRSSDMGAVVLVHACTADPATDRHIAEDARRCGALVVGPDDSPVSMAAARPGGAGVVLVGGGPGDPELLTLRGYRALLEADVVVTDRLGPTGLLAELPPAIEIVDVGKTPRGPAARQEDINDLLISRARAGARVVRLKGGDPFVFGRGGEEVQACATAGVAVEVVPGVTSAIAAPALAGIPLTHRGLSQHFTVVSGHVPPDDPRSSVDWAALAGAGGTLVLLMAVENRVAIAASLVAGGRSPDTTVAVAESMSTEQQRAVVTTLAELGSVCAVPPAVIVVGDVVALATPVGR
ncbi:MAG: uroporphyrinogen-III C-methyltransferase [Mycobacteriales bacterium]